MSDARYVTIHGTEGWRVFGEFITEWANGTKTPPQTIAEFRQQVPHTVVELGPGFPDDEPVAVLQRPPMAEQLSIVLPAAAELQTPLPTGTWPLPAFYSEIAYGGAPTDVPQVRQSEFRSCRIADYSTGRCM